MKKITGRFASSDKKNSVAYYIYEPDISPRAVIQISHGMCEYIERYEPHAEYFCEQGFVFAGNDHLGHGNTAANDDDLGYIGNADMMVADLSAMTDILKERYPGVPVVLLGHSMGSFILREYMTKYSDKLGGAIISGTAGPESPTGAGKLLCSILSLIYGDRHRSKLLFSMSVGAYSKAFPNQPKESWLTRDERVQKKYANDKFCTFKFTVNANRALFDILGRVSKRGWAKKLDPSLPTMLISGADDPVGGCGKGVKKVYDRMVGAGHKKAELFLLDNVRHEPFNELEPERSLAYKIVTDWINRVIYEYRKNKGN